MPGSAALIGPADKRLLGRFAAQFAAAVADGSEVHEVAGFKVHLWPRADPFYRNVAVPIGGPARWPPAIAEMSRIFAAHGRRATLEFFAQLWPDLVGPLEDAGFRLDESGEVMALHRSGFRPSGRPWQARLLDGATPLPQMTGFLRAATATFGDRAALLAPGELERFADGLARGTIVAALTLDGTTPVSGAVLIGHGGVAELAGVWTDARRRRGGLASATCARLLQHFFAAGGEYAWLSADDAASAALYRRLGFVPCGQQLNYVGPGATA